jgi:hypothetical protein
LGASSTIFSRPSFLSQKVVFWSGHPWRETPHGKLTIMSKLVDDAVRVLRELPEDVQAATARAIIEYGAGYDDDLALSEEQVGEAASMIPIAISSRSVTCALHGSIDPSGDAQINALDQPRKRIRTLFEDRAVAHGRGTRAVTMPIEHRDRPLRVFD